jgi:hypothetical protein
MLDLHRSANRHRRLQFLHHRCSRCGGIHTEPAQRLMHRGNQPPELIGGDAVFGNIAANNLGNEPRIDFSCAATVLGHSLIPHFVLGAISTDRRVFATSEGEKYLMLAALMFHRFKARPKAEADASPEARGNPAVRRARRTRARHRAQLQRRSQHDLAASLIRINRFLFGDWRSCRLGIPLGTQTSRVPGSRLLCTTCGRILLLLSLS